MLIGRRIHLGKIYAVVDIETTGTNAKEDQIIQFACTLVENGQMIHTFATDINPGKPIPKMIQRLTHLDNRRLKNAPYFEDVAETIYHLLAGTIFVAHNVHFDYTFLSKTFVKYGFPKLTIDAIDTVELAQIFLPTAKSFRLNDLVESIGFKHDRPHQADSDAYVTAQLFLHLTEKIKSLPLATLGQILPLAPNLSRQTGEYIQKIYHQREVAPEIFDTKQFFKVDNLVLKRRTVLNERQFAIDSNLSFPKTKKGKEKYFVNQWTLGKEQAKLMNLLHQQFSAEGQTDPLLIELSASQFTPRLFFLPIEFQVRANQPIILSYASDEFVKEWYALSSTEQVQFTFMNQMMNYYAEESYIDLFKFKLSLEKKTDQKLTALYQMMILVWLTETTTGEWSELGLYNEDQPFFKEVSCQKDQTIKLPSIFEQADFITWRNQRLLTSQVVLVNHQQLCERKLDDLLANERFKQILFAEFQYLLATLTNRPAIALNSKQADKLLARVLEWANAQRPLLIEPIKQSLNHLAAVVRLVDEIQRQFFEEWIEYFNHPSEQIWTQARATQLPVRLYRNSQQLLKAYAEIVTLIDQLKTQANNKQTHSEVDYPFVKECFEYAQALQEHQQILKDWFEDWQTPTLHTFLIDAAKQQVTLNYYAFARLHPMFAYLNEQFTKVIAVGSGFYLPFDKDYIQRRTQIQAPIKRLTFAEENLQVKLLVPKNGLSIPEADTASYIDYLSSKIRQALVKEEACLVVFNSQEVLTGVYQAIHEQLTKQGQELWAVGVNSSLAKILKRFESANYPLVFILMQHLVDSNLGKLHFPKVIIARLPFSNPTAIKTKLYYEYLKKQGLDPFYNDSLPQATLRLRRAFDLLDFSKESILIVLDKRIVTTAYGKKMQKILPKQLHWQEYLALADESDEKN